MKRILERVARGLHSRTRLHGLECGAQRQHLDAGVFHAIVRAEAERNVGMMQLLLHGVVAPERGVEIRRVRPSRRAPRTSISP